MAFDSVPMNGVVVSALTLLDGVSGHQSDSENLSTHTLALGLLESVVSLADLQEHASSRGQSALGNYSGLAEDFLLASDRVSLATENLILALSHNQHKQERWLAFQERRDGFANYSDHLLVDKTSLEENWEAEEAENGARLAAIELEIAGNKVELLGSLAPEVRQGIEIELVAEFKQWQDQQNLQFIQAADYQRDISNLNQEHVLVGDNLGEIEAFLPGVQEDAAATGLRVEGLVGSSLAVLNTAIEESHSLRDFLYTQGFHLSNPERLEVLEEFRDRQEEERVLVGQAIALLQPQAVTEEEIGELLWAYQAYSTVIESNLSWVEGQLEGFEAFVESRPSEAVIEELEIELISRSHGALETNTLPLAQWVDTLGEIKEYYSWLTGLDDVEARWQDLREAQESGEEILSRLQGELGQLESERRDGEELLGDLALQIRDKEREVELTEEYLGIIGGELGFIQLPYETLERTI